MATASSFRITPVVAALIALDTLVALCYIVDFTLVVYALLHWIMGLDPQHASFWQIEALTAVFIEVAMQTIEPDPHMMDAVRQLPSFLNKETFSFPQLIILMKFAPLVSGYAYLRFVFRRLRAPSLQASDGTAGTKRDDDEETESTPDDVTKSREPAAELRWRRKWPKNVAGDNLLVQEEARWQREGYSPGCVDSPVDAYLASVKTISHGAIAAQLSTTFAFRVGQTLFAGAPSGYRTLALGVRVAIACGSGCQRVLDRRAGFPKEEQMKLLVAMIDFGFRVAYICAAPNLSALFTWGGTAGMYTNLMAAALVVLTWKCWSSGTSPVIVLAAVADVVLAVNPELLGKDSQAVRKVTIGIGAMHNASIPVVFGPLSILILLSERISVTSGGGRVLKRIIPFVLAGSDGPSVGLWCDPHPDPTDPESHATAIVTERMMRLRYVTYHLALAQEHMLIRVKLPAWASTSKSAKEKLVVRQHLIRRACRQLADDATEPLEIRLSQARCNANVDAFTPYIGIKTDEAPPRKIPKEEGEAGYRSRFFRDSDADFSEIDPGQEAAMQAFWASETKSVATLLPQRVPLALKPLDLWWTAHFSGGSFAASNLHVWERLSGLYSVVSVVVATITASLIPSHVLSTLWPQSWLSGVFFKTTLTLWTGAFLVRMLRRFIPDVSLAMDLSALEPLEDVCDGYIEAVLASYMLPLPSQAIAVATGCGQDEDTTPLLPMDVVGEVASFLPEVGGVDFTTLSLDEAEQLKRTPIP